MPKDTFIQLPQDKQVRVLGAATQIFASAGFDRADVARIAQAAGVAKGSIYNYFETKDDLYLYVCQVGLKAFRDQVYGTMEPGGDIFLMVAHMFQAGARFAKENPDTVRLYLNLSSAGMDRFAEAIAPEMESFFADRFKALLGESARRGLIRPGIDVSMTAFLINNLFMTLVVAPVSRHHRIRLRAYWPEEEKAMDDDRGDDDRIRRAVGLIHNFLKP
jgi:AcrR family transcriptional regulator